MEERREERREDEEKERRTLCVIAHVDHGKTTLTDALVRRAGLSHKERSLDHARPDQVDRIITIKSTGAVMEIDGMLLNLIDSPGHVDFSSEVSAALRLTDGAIVVVDCASGVKVQTRTVLRQALQEGVRPVLVLNKLDRLVLELHLTEEEIYQRCLSIVNEINDLIATYTAPPAVPIILNPQNGSVIFASGKSQWGFTLPQLAARYAHQLGKTADAVLNTLWGDVFFNENKRWSRTQNGPRGFAVRVARVLIASLKGLADEQSTNGALSVLGGQRGALATQVPLADALISCIRNHLPSPREAQRYRVDLLYTGPRDDPVYAGIRDCDPNGPLVIFVAKMTPDASMFWAFGRVLSGTVRRNHKVLVLGPSYDPVKAAAEEGDITRPGNDAHAVVVQSVASPMGVSWKQLDTCPAGGIVALSGIDKVVSKTATIVDGDAARGGRVLHPIRQMKFSVAPIVAYSVRCKNGADLPAFNLGLQRLAKADSLVQIRHDEETKETLIVGSGELHLEILLGDLKRLAKDIDLVVGKPSVSLRETVLSTGQPALAKSSNKHNRVVVVAGPLASEVVVSMERGDAPRADRKQWAAGYGTSEAAECGYNALQDETKAVDYLAESKGPFVDAFKRLAQNGPLCGEQLRGVELRLQDAKLHQDRAHRGGGELMEMSRRAFSGAILQAEPRLMEPMLRVSIEAPSSMAGVIYQFVSQRRGLVVQEEPRDGLPLSIWTAIVPAIEAFGLDSGLRAATSGEGFPSSEFSHWSTVESDPLEEGTLANRLLLATRERKKMKAMPQASDYVDRL